jgi:pimeloyl-ACP methyl ester carboxylesterase
MIRACIAVFILLLCLPARDAEAASTCDPDGTQASGSIYRICMPPAGEYNGMLVIWAHGFQDAGTPVQIPEDQLCVNDFCIPEIINGLGFGFATNSYSKTGLAILEGKDDILDLVGIYATAKGAPTKVYLVGASEGGIITALSVEQRPDVFSAGVAACGPIGDFPLQIGYFGDARATFQVFFPGLIPGDPFAPDPALAADWANYYSTNVEPIVFAPANASRLDQWARVARLPFDAGNYIPTLRESVRDVLRYSVVNLTDAANTLGGFPFDNLTRNYTGSSNDFLLNLFVPRIGADPAAVTAMNTAYRTTGALTRPLITLHTKRDQQVPFFHQYLYALKTISAGTFLSRHLPISIDRFEHCNFTEDEVVASFAIMLLYDGLVEPPPGPDSALRSKVAAFMSAARAKGLR